MSDRILLNASFNPNYQLHIVVVPEDAQQLVTVKEEAPEEQSSDVDQQDSEPPNIKKEEEEAWTTQEGDRLDVKNETDATRFPLTSVSVKTEDDEEKQLLSRFHQHQMEDFPASSSDDQMEAVTGGEDCEGVEIVWNPDLKTYDDNCNSSEPDVSEDAEEDDDDDDTSTDSQQKDFSKSEDWDKDWKESRSFESSVNAFICPECGEQFPHNQSLQRHMSCHLGTWSLSSLGNSKYVRVNEDEESPKDIQTKPKVFSCDDCGKIFNRKTNLNRHTRIHTGQKPFSCYFCGRRFSDKANFNRHVTIHTGQKPFSCDVCGHRFSLESELNSHVIIHTGQRPCTVCGQIFSQKMDLDRHMRIHTGQKPFGC
ncbi:zinc finger protein 568, partial [Austrofundulus limnaeus]|uniref:Zinc finger protein 568 n=1 Tax=Austrofundulus limnaeus TaxID=52670 RepID=A0A2I4CY01_AUSLI